MIPVKREKKKIRNGMPLSDSKPERGNVSIF
jgi:hypothetical protein